MNYVVERLNENHICDWFDCGYGNALGNWLIKWGRKYEERHQSAIWVMCEQGSTEVLGYFCLSSQVIDSKALPRAMRGGDFYFDLSSRTAVGQICYRQVFAWHFSEPHSYERSVQGV